MREHDGSREVNMIRIGIGVLLVAVAGYVDAVGFIELGGFFASFMSGASISLGVASSESQWVAAGQAGLLISAFVGAALTANLLSGLLVAWELSAILALESVCLFLAVLMTLDGWDAASAIVPVVAAMGVQNGALRPVKGVRLGVTFMTGTLVSVGEALAGLLLRRTAWRVCCAHALLWCAFVAGAATGTRLHATAGFLAVAGPAFTVAVLALAATIETMRPRRTRRS